MISLCLDKEKIACSVDSVGSYGFLKTLIHSYLEPYGTKFRFCEFYLQYIDDCTTAVILRYNTYLYLLSDKNADIDELSAFLMSFSGSYLISDREFSDCYTDVKTCYLMSSVGEKNFFSSYVKDVSESPKIIADIVTKGMSLSCSDDFYLNTAHQLRHKTLSAYARFVDGTAVSVVGFTKKYRGVSAITFVYTDEHFRGNGYSKEILQSLCVDNDCEYQLLCEEHNLNFYKKCGFIQSATCFEVRL